MENKDYQQNALRTESSNFEEIRKRLHPAQTLRILHATMGLNTENGELQDALKKYVFYGKPLDKVNLLEEFGDALWYCAIGLDALGADFSQVMETNIAKLRARYPDKFTEHNALNRNLPAERQVLELDDQEREALET